MILPERVLGSPETNSIWSSFAMGPICLDINWFISFLRLSPQ